MPNRDLSMPPHQLSFTGTAYLGIPHQPIFRRYLLEGMDIWGTHYGGSRRSNAAPEIYEAAEILLSEFVGAESALLFSSGTLAGQLLVKVLRQEADLHLAPGVHPALWWEEGPIFRDFEEWQQSVAQQCAEPGPPIALLANAVDPLGVRRFDFSFLSGIQIRRRVILVVDDSHGFLLLGEKGQGIFPEIAGIDGIEPLVISSLGKAGSIPAGVILGPKMWTDSLRNAPFFGGASPTPPAYIYAFVHSKELYAAQRTALRELLSYFTGHLTDTIPLHFMPEFPVFLLQQPGYAKSLSAAGIEISSFSYPTPLDPPVSRIVINAGHTVQHLQILLDTLTDLRKNPPI